MRRVLRAPIRWSWERRWRRCHLDDIRARGDDEREPQSDQQGPNGRFAVPSIRRSEEKTDEWMELQKQL